MKKTPFIAIGNGELDEQPSATKGTKILHKHDNGEWEEAEIFYPINEDGSESNMVGFYKLKNGQTFIASVKGKLLKRELLKLSE